MEKRDRSRSGTWRETTDRLHGVEITRPMSHEIAAELEAESRELRQRYLFTVYEMTPDHIPGRFN